MRRYRILRYPIADDKQISGTERTRADVKPEAIIARLVRQVVCLQALRDVYPNQEGDSRCRHEHAT